MVTMGMSLGGKVQGTRQWLLWKGSTTLGSTGSQGAGPGLGLGRAPWTCCRSYVPRITFSLGPALKMVTKGSPALCRIR